MKKGICFLLTIITFILSSCSHIDSASDFSADSIDNGFYNFINGGKLAYKNNNLYYVANTSILYDSTYVINKKGSKKVFQEVTNNSIKYYPRIYQNKDELLLYITHDNYEESIYQYDANEKLTQRIDVDDGILTYYEKHLRVESTYDDKGDSLMNVFYRDRNSYQLHSFDGFIIYHDKIYLWERGRIYCNNPEIGSDTELITEFGFFPDILLVNDHYCYGYTSCNYENNYKPTLYCYSFERNKKKKLYEKRILSMNTIDDQVFFCAEDGVYTADGKECRKVSDIQAKEIYIVDEKWIYLIDDNTNLYRITHDGLITEQIEIDDN